MGIFDFWPYTNLHELNLDWLGRIVREWVDKSDEYFKTTDEKITYLQNNFDALKEYVNNYFESLDVQEEVQNVLDQWLADGTIESLLVQPFVLYSDFYKGEFDGNLILRTRKARVKSGDVNWTLQNGALYAPDGNYSLDNPDMRIYLWWCSSDNAVSQFKTFNMNNQEINSFAVTGMAHGGPIVFKDGKGYSMNSNKRLTIFNMQNPDAPTVERQRTLTLQSTYLIGVMGDDFIGIKQDIDNRKLSVFKIPSDFNNELFLFELEGGLTGLFQDACVDAEKKKIYWLSYEPNVIHVHSLVDGSQVSQMKIPDVIGYVGVGEAEFMDVKGDIMVMASFQGVGTAQDNNLDIKVWASTPESMGDNSRKVPINTAGTRNLSVRYQTADGRNPNVNALNGSIVFKYIEDAQHCAKAMNKGAVININEDYNEGWQLFVDTVIAFQYESKTKAFNIDQNVNATINNLNGFLDTPMTQDYIKCYINQREGSRVVYNNLPDVDVGTADVVLYAEKCEVNIQSATNLVNHLAMYAGKLTTPGGIGGNVYFLNTIINANYLDASLYETQYISASSVCQFRVQKGSTVRPSITDMTSGIRIPHQFYMLMRTSANFNYRPIENIWGMKGSDGTTNVTSGYYDNASQTYKTYTYTINREVVQVPLTNFPGTYYRYWISATSMPSELASVIGLPIML